MITKSTKIFGATSIVFLSVCITVFVGFFYLILKQEQTYTESSIARAQSKALQASLETLEHTKPQRDFLFSRIITEEEVVNLLSFIELLSKEQGVVTTKSPTVVPLAGKFETLLIAIQIEGSRDAIMQTLKLLEQLPYQTTVTNVQLSQKNAEDDALWRGALEVRIMKYKKI